MNLIPMAGEGKRFKDAGFETPKPLIEIGGVPMYVRAILAMPLASKYIIIKRKEHNIEYPPGDSVIINIHKTTAGQLSTCLLAREHITDEPLFIGACDHEMLWDMKKYKKLLKEFDVLVWTFTRQSNLLIKPESWSWVKSHDGVCVDDVSFKKAVSHDPYTDYAMTGAFSFSCGKVFLNLAEEIIKKDMRINREFYVDMCVKLALEKGLKVGMMVVDKYVGFGTPEDLKEYKSWEEYFNETVSCNPLL